MRAGGQADGQGGRARRTNRADGRAGGQGGRTGRTNRADEKSGHNEEERPLGPPGEVWNGGGPLGVAERCGSV